MILRADARALPIKDESVQVCVTSPPYFGLRNYGVAGQIGLEPTLGEYVDEIIAVFREVRRVLRPDGTLWINLGDSYATAGGAGKQGTSGQRAIRTFTAEGSSAKGVPVGLKAKDLLGVPWRVAFALQADGWWLRRDIVWSKPNPMPESVKDRPTTAHEYIFLMAKAERYYYDADAIAEPCGADTHARYARGRSDHHKYADGGPGGQTLARSLEHMVKAGVGPKAANRPCAGWQSGPGSHSTVDHARPKEATNTKFKVKQNESFAAATAAPVQRRAKRSVWTITSEPYPGSHFATFPSEIPRLCILAGSRPGDVVLDPFGGSGTTAKVALELGRRAVHVDLTYHDLAKKRTSVTPAMAGLMR